MMHLELKGARRSGKTTMLCNHLATFLARNLDAEALVVVPTTVAMNLFKERLRDVGPAPGVMDRVKIVTPFSKGSDGTRGKLYDAVYVDGKSYIGEDSMLALIPVAQYSKYFVTTEDV
jgi:hypothetical protein